MRYRKRHHRRLATECLESKRLLDATGLLWPDLPDLTISFAPDGTTIGGESSSLDQTLDQFGESDWKQTILRAFQTWAAETNANIGVKNDAGLPFGTPGSRIRDERFGDIRVGARPLANDVMAISISHGSVLSGTWAGDVILNSDATFESLDDLYSVALHEAGHVLGLEHSDIPNSPMHIHGVSDNTVLTASDVDAIHQLYGQRTDDPFETESHHTDNNSVRKAAELEGGEAIPEVKGSAPALVFGDITTPSDIDVFKIDGPEGYRGPVTLQLVTSEISLLDANITLMSESGAVLDSASSSGSQGIDAELHVAGLPHSSELFVEVKPNPDSPFQVGTYTLIATFDNLNVVSDATIDEVAHSSLRRLISDDFDDFFDADEDEFFHDDNHSDDDYDSANSLVALDSFGLPQHYEYVGSITSSNDQDYYALASPLTLNNATLTLAIQTLEAGQLIPQVTAFGPAGDRLELTTLVNGNGELVVQAGDIEPGSVYRVLVAGADSTIGNYQLTATFGSEPIHLQNFVHGEVADRVDTHSLYVATPQLFHFALTVSGQPTNITDAAVLTRLLDSNGQVVTQFTAARGQTRTAASVLLSPGTFQLQSFPLLSSNATGTLGYEINGAIVSDPFGIDPLQPSAVEFRCPDVADAFCYPGGIQSSDPYLWDDFLIDHPELGTVDVNTIDNLVIGDWWNWYWQQTGLNNGPPMAFSDRYETVSDTAISVEAIAGVLANDIDPNADLLTASVATEPLHGELTLRADGSFDYVPAIGYVGDDRFQYRVSDPSGKSRIGSVSIAIHQKSPGLRGDFSDDGIVDIEDVELIRSAVASASDSPWFDLDHDGHTNETDWELMIIDVVGTSFGDANLDGRFDSSDLVLVFQHGGYEDGVIGNAKWYSGDWNADGEFNSRDLILAFQMGTYELAARPGIRSALAAAIAADADKNR